MLAQVRAIDERLTAKLNGLKKDVREAIVSAQAELAGLRARWDGLYSKAESEYQQLLRSLTDDTANLSVLDSRLRNARDRESQLVSLQSDIETKLQPHWQELFRLRDELLDTLQPLRRKIRDKRLAKADELTQALDRKVHVVVNHAADSKIFLDELMNLKVGSRISDDAVAVMAEKLHPVPFVKSLHGNRFDELASWTGLEARTFERLREHVLGDDERFEALYELQIVDVEDQVDARLALTDTEYRDLEALAHGQKCTVILMVALAEGTFPISSDQPEDALHTPFIESYIVETLRNRRGVRQFILSTRNANILVSGDAEQVFSLASDELHGEVQKTGSIDRFETRELILLELEGGAEAFERRRRKYGLP